VLNANLVRLEDLTDSVTVNSSEYLTGYKLYAYGKLRLLTINYSAITSTAWIVSLRMPNGSRPAVNIPMTIGEEAGASASIMSASYMDTSGYTRIVFSVAHGSVNTHASAVYVVN